jgi:hypothetical protein
MLEIVQDRLQRVSHLLLQRVGFFFFKVEKVLFCCDMQLSFVHLPAIN